MPDSKHAPLKPTWFHILLALADEERHGLGIVEEVERRSDGEVKLGPGTLYGTIKRMRRAGLIEEAADGEERDTRRRYYAITRAGRSALRAPGRTQGAPSTARPDRTLPPAGFRQAAATIPGGFHCPCLHGQGGGARARSRAAQW